MFNENTEELAQNKLLLLYIIDKSQSSLSNSQITEFVLEKNYMNYFLIQQFLSELVESKFIEYTKNNESEKYILLSKGKIALECFIDRIPKEMKKDVNEKFQIEREEAKRDTQIIGDYYKKRENEYIVYLKLVENESILFSLNINVVSSKQAKMICEKWKSNPEFIYQNILSALID